MLPKQTQKSSASQTECMSVIMAKNNKIWCSCDLLTRVLFFFFLLNITCVIYHGDFIRLRLPSSWHGKLVLWLNLVTLVTHSFCILKQPWDVRSRICCRSQKDEPLVQKKNRNVLTEKGKDTFGYSWLNDLWQINKLFCLLSDRLLKQTSL